MTTLRGHSRPVKIKFLQYVLDHAYVTCAAGHCWPCWGDCLDGTVLRTGEGSSARADAIAGRDAHAGIHYAVTGLCTQTANRILWPAGVTVADAMGYEITEFFFGTYGPSASDWIEYRDSSDGTIGETPQCKGTEEPAEKPSSHTASALLSFIIGLYETLTGGESQSEAPTPNFDLLNGILEARVQAVLGADFSRERIQQLQSTQRTFVERKMLLDQNVIAREISGREFAEQANDVINDGLREAAEVLDRESYTRLFNVRPGAEIAAIRPDICAEVYDGETREPNA